MKFINDVVEGIFSFDTHTNGKKIMTFKATAIKRFSIILAFWHNRAWRIRSRIVVSLTNGVVAFPLTKMLFNENGRVFVPDEYKLNTVLFMGMHTLTNEVNASLRIYANASGTNIVKANGNFNGY